MRIAVPITDGALAAHFGHCETFALFDVDPATASIVGRSDVVPPPHEPGVLPGWLGEQGASVIIAAGMGSRARQLFAQQDIAVVAGVGVADPTTLVEQYVAGRLRAGENFCDH